LHLPYHIVAASVDCYKLNKRGSSTSSLADGKKSLKKEGGEIRLHPEGSADHPGMYFTSISSIMREGKKMTIT
jgi:hypothetical protein